MAKARALVNEVRAYEREQIALRLEESQWLKAADLARNLDGDRRRSSKDPEPPKRPTICAECRHVERFVGGREHWRCNAGRIEPSFTQDRVTGESVELPGVWAFCEDKNRGARDCPDFEPKGRAPTIRDNPVINTGPPSLWRRLRDWLKAAS